MNRRDFLRASLATTGLLLAGKGTSAEKTRKLSDEDILAQTRERIEKHRKGDGTIRVLNARAKPVRNARVKVEQLSHGFLFGSNFFMFGRCGKPELEEAYRARFAALLNYCTLGFYWASYEWERGKPNYAYTEQTAAWAVEHGITCKGHPLVWDHPASNPNWLPDDAKQIEQLSLNRVRDIVTHFRDSIHFWDVVNEATHLTDKVHKTKMAEWAVARGAIPYVAEHLKTARAANPNATLLVNDYRTDPPYFQILQGLRDGGRYLFDAVGIQSHMHDRLWPMQKVWSVCDAYAELGLPIHFTESTIVSGPRKGPGENWGETTEEGEARQAEAVVKFYATLFAHPAVQAITWWDFTDLGAWQGAAAGWLRKDMSPKPVYERLMSLIKREWWTKYEGETDRRGEVKLRAFYGKHRVTVDMPNGQRTVKEVDWERGKKNDFQLP